MLKRLNTQVVILYFDAQPPWLRYSLAVLIAAIATITTCLIPLFGERAAFLLFFFAIIQATLWLGLNQGMVVMALSLVAVNGLVLLPAKVLGPYDIFILNTGFCILSFVIIATANLHRNLTIALWESRQNLQNAQAVGQIGSWRLNMQDNHLLWSDENYRIFGIPKGKPVTYQDFLSIVHPDDQSYVDQRWQANLHGEPYDIEYRLLVAGKLKWVRERGVSKFNKKRLLFDGFGTTQDITARKRYELQLAESRQQYSAIFASAMDAIITLDADQRIVLFNASAEKMFGCTADEAIGESIDQLIPEWFSAVRGAHMCTFEDAGITNCQKDALGAVTGLRASGQEFPVEVSLSKCEMDGKKSYTAILRDVTDRMRIESALKERLRLQDQLTKIAASVPGVICSFRLRPDGSSHMPYASPVFESVTGLSREVVAEDFSPFFASVHSDDVNRVNDTTTESARSLRPWQGIFRYHHPVKGEIWIESHSMPQREDDNSILWHGHIRDVTEHKRVEQELQERIERYELVLDGAQDGIWDWDVRNKLIHLSSRWKALRGFAEDEIGNSEEDWRANIHPDDLARVVEAVQSHFDGKKPVFCEEYRIRCKDGSWRWILDRGVSKRDESGQVIRMAGSESDITDRKLAEWAVRDRENELRLIMDATPALISYLDTDFRYLRVNATYQDWFCMPLESIVGHEAREIIGEAAWTIVQPYLERTLAGERISFDQAIPYGKGQSRWVHASYIPDIEATGKVKGIVAHIVDIEERKQAEQKIAVLNQNLQQRIEEMQVIFDTVPIGLSIANDPTGHSIRGNPASERLFGVGPGNNLSMRVESAPAIHVMQAGRELAVEELPMQRAIRGGIVADQIMNITRPDGQIITVLGNASPLFDEEGAPRGAVGAFLDITELKRVEESLKKSQVQLRLFIEQAPISIAMFDREINYLVTSCRWIEEFGRGYADLTGLNHYEVNPDLLDEWKEVHRKTLAGAFLKNDDDFWIQNDGSRLWLRWTASPWTDQEGEIGGIIISCEDITLSRKAEEELRNAEARLALVIEEVKAGYWDWDLNTHKLYLSPECKRQIGFDENERLNRWEEWECRLHPADRALVVAAAEDCIAGRKTTYELEFRLRHKDGSYRWIHSRGGVLRDYNDHPYRMLGIHLNITDYMKTKELSERRDKMEKSFRLYVASQTAAAIAHELNQPLAAICSYSDAALMMLKTGNPNPQKLSHALQNCTLQAQRSGQVIRQLLMVLHKGEAAIEPIDINVSIHETLELIKADEYLGAFKIELDLAADLPPVMANSLQIQKVLINLLRNGLESMQEIGMNAGTLKVKTGFFAANPAMVQVTVCDYGKGVPDTGTLKLMFQPFYTTKTAGLGMGLAISRVLIEAHGGKMWAEQNDGIGLSIHFTLPIMI